MRGENSKLKYMLVKIAVSLLFILIVSFVVMILAADIHFSRAQHLESLGSLSKAGDHYIAALKFSPLDSDYAASYGSFILRKDNDKKDKSYGFQQAKSLYEKAISLNPGHAHYRYLLGTLLIDSGANIDEAGENFRAANERDLYNLRQNYLIGYNLLFVWDKLDQDLKKFAIQRLRYYIGEMPWRSGEVYEHVMRYTGDFIWVEDVCPPTPEAHRHLYEFIRERDLWEYRKRVKDRLNGILSIERSGGSVRRGSYKDKIVRMLRSKDQELEKDKWSGISANGQNFYKDGKMYWEGSVHTLIELSAGEATIEIQARGEPANDISPYMLVKIEGEEIGEAFVESEEWKVYPFNVFSEGGEKVITVTYLNNGGKKRKGEDRNLYVGEVSVKGEGE